METYGVFRKYGDDGQVKERTAFSPADRVKLRFDGWEEQDPTPEPAPATSTTTVKKTGGRGSATVSE